MKNLAKKIADGLRAGELAVNKLGFSPAEAQKIYRQMQKENYKGNLPFYVCEKILEESYGEMIAAVGYHERADQDYPPAEKMAEMYKENNKDAIFCSLQAILPKLGNKKWDYIAKILISSLHS